MQAEEDRSKHTVTLSKGRKCHVHKPAWEGVKGP